ncbi:MAG: S1 RNA-binding domain-containing protein, partial [Anaerolineae bacterium]|nr:S1 RNA-binding domain-containing protein [Anaerolineae bacterium]
RKRRRLVFSQREAQRERREARKEALLEKLQEGDIRTGTVSGLRDFGAFVDLGGADGLIHISELAWHRVKHPREVVNIGDQVEVYILRLDAEGKRIGLSLKRTQPNPWSRIEELYHVGQLVEGVVSRVAQFGAFVSLEPGVEALLHASQISDPAPVDASTVIYEGQTLWMRIISIEADKQRLGLSLKEVTGEEQDRWQSRRTESGILPETEGTEVPRSQDVTDSVQLETAVDEA